jgi:hypothetical protein
VKTAGTGVDGSDVCRIAPAPDVRQGTLLLWLLIGRNVNLVVPVDRETRRT